jgi:hypothetical protein
MDGIFVPGLAAGVAVAATAVIAMLLYPRLDVTLDPLRVRFEMHAWRPSVRRRRGNKKPRR